MEKLKPAAIKVKGFEPKCPICLECWNNNVVLPWVFPCGHMICERCLLKHKEINRKCHMCREKIKLTTQRRKKQKANRIERKNIVRLRIEEYYEQTEKIKKD